MSFESIQFAIFLPIMFALYWGCRPKYRWIVVFAANIVFYAFAGIPYLFLLLWVCIIVFIFIKVLDRVRNRFVLFCGIIAVFGPLFFFKYFGFFQNNLNYILNASGSGIHFEAFDLILPLGISFYTFSAAAYMFDCYKNNKNRKYGILQLITGIAFFPCLIAGPIERQEHLLPQILEQHPFDYDEASYGLKRIALGLFKKMVIADTLAVPVNKIFSDVHAYHGLTLTVAMILFTIEVYCDFSGYSDISIGVSRLLGIKLYENFRSPFFSSSYTELWRRWHVSLSSWFRDYIYIPLGGSRKGIVRKNINTMVVFLVSGFWHGAAWTYIAWGGLNGAVQMVESLLPKQKRNNAFLNIVRMAVVYLVFCILAVFFRANSCMDAVSFLTNIIRDILHPAVFASGFFEALGMSLNKMLIVAGMIMILAWYDIVALKRDPIELISEKPLLLRWLIYVVFVLMIAQFSSKGASVEFIYAAF